MQRVGKYQLLRKLATGGMAEVFLARAGGPMGFQLAGEERAAKARQATQAPVAQAQQSGPAPGVSGARVAAWVAGGVGLLSAGAATFFLVSAVEVHRTHGRHGTRERRRFGA